MRIQRLAGIFTGEGFVKKQGRHPELQDCGFIAGPIDLVINNSGQITSIEKSSALKSDAGFNASGLIATAGFVDSHTHALFAGDRSHEFFLRWKGATYREISDSGGGIHNTVRDTTLAKHEELETHFRANLRAMMLSGVTTTEVKTGYTSSAEQEIALLRFLKRFRTAPNLPRVKTTFLALHALPKDRIEKDFVDEMIAALDTVSAEDLADFVDTFPEQGFFTLAESLRFTNAATKRGLKAKIHADELSDMKAAEHYTARGALSIDHLQKLNDSGLLALSTSTTVATLLPATSFFLRLEYTNARRILQAGARVALATDFNPGTAPSPSFQLTMLLAATAMRMSAPEILCASTFNGAGALGLDTTHGALMPGYAADLLLWSTHSRSPEQSLEEIIVRSRAPRAIFRGGVCVHIAKDG